MNPGKDPLGDLHKMAEDESSGGWDAECDHSQHPKNQAGPGIHQLGLQQPHSITYKRIVTSVELLLPFHPILRRFIVPLHHLHLVNSLPKNNQIFIH